jgi:hypothetical protein
MFGLTRKMCGSLNFAAMHGHSPTCRIFLLGWGIRYCVTTLEFLDANKRFKRYVACHQRRPATVSHGVIPPNSLHAALKELGRMERTLFMLELDAGSRTPEARSSRAQQGRGEKRARSGSLFQPPRRALSILNVYFRVNFSEMLRQRECFT